MTSSPGLLQHRNSASSTPKINLCREVLYPPPLGQALSLPTSPSVAGTEHGWKSRFSCSQAAWHRAAGRSRAGLHSQLPLSAAFCWMLGALAALGTRWGHTQRSPNSPCAKRCQNPSLMDGEWHHCAALVLSRPLAPNSGQHQYPKDPSPALEASSLWDLSLGVKNQLLFPCDEEEDMVSSPPWHTFAGQGLQGNAGRILQFWSKRN